MQRHPPRCPGPRHSGADRKGKQRPLDSDGSNYTKRTARWLRRISEFGIDHHGGAPDRRRCQDGRAHRRNGVARVAREDSEAGSAGDVDLSLLLVEEKLLATPDAAM